MKLARKYTKQPPPLEIPSLESMRARGSDSSSNSPIVPSPSSASTQVSLRAQKRSKWRKMDEVLRTYSFDSLGEFLSVLFHPQTNDEIYYKLEEQLTSYFNGAYKDSANIHLSCARARDETRPLDTELRNNTRADRIVNALLVNSSRIVLYRALIATLWMFHHLPRPPHMCSSMLQQAAFRLLLLKRWYKTASNALQTRLPAGNQTRRPGKNARVIDAHEGWTARAKGVGFIIENQQMRGADEG
ncbi:hypothetical protein B0H14DRAFT_3449649 [Mycena olivaceomarginata]|nr:hypothetical protein B0H14DRAFT_3449649 [Mycena olivaceomarginata]